MNRYSNNIPMEGAGLICDFRPGVSRTWISMIEEPPEDFPEYFTTEDMEAENIEPNIEGMAAAQRQKAMIESWSDEQ